MAFDAFYLSCVLQELRECPEPRVEKIHQPARDTVVLHLRHRLGRVKLIIAANPAAPRLYLTQTQAENPAQPPMFCMLLRKHLSGARLVSVEQPSMERCAVLTFDCIDEMGDPTQKRLVAELMGRTCNLYLLSADGRIIDCLRRVGLDAQTKRQALPGLYYQQPEPVEKKDPLALDEESYVNLLKAPGADILAQRLMDTLGGLSPLVCREAALYAAGDTDARMIHENVTSSERYFHSRIPHDFLICAKAAESHAFIQMDEELAYHRRHDSNVGGEEHRIQRLLNKARKLHEIEKYLKILTDFEQENVLKTQEGKTALYKKTQSMQQRLNALQSGKISRVIDNARKNRENVRFATMLCDILIVKQK